MIWSHDENKHISILESQFKQKCPICGKYYPKYVKSWYSGGLSCVLLTKYCRFCGWAVD